MSHADPLQHVRIVLCETSHPGNIGAAARAMKTMGLPRLQLVSPQRFPDPEATWRASNATDVLEQATVHDTLDDALRDVAFVVACSARIRDISVPAVNAREAAMRVIETARSQPTALVFGNEKSGLTTEQVNKCNLLAYIPANPGYTSLNLGAAVQVFTYECRMAAARVEPLPERPLLARHDEVEGFYAHLESVMADAGFLNREHPKKLMPRLRRLFGRSGLEPEEVNILRGILKALTRPPRS